MGRNAHDNDIGFAHSLTHVVGGFQIFRESDVGQVASVGVRLGDFAGQVGISGPQSSGRIVACERSDGGSPGTCPQDGDPQAHTLLPLKQSVSSDDWVAPEATLFERPVETRSRRQSPYPDDSQNVALQDTQQEVRRFACSVHSTTAKR